MRVLMVTSSLARFRGDADAAAGMHVHDLVSELGRSVEGTVLAPMQAGASLEERIGGFTVRRVFPERPTHALHHAIHGVSGAARTVRVARALRRAAAALAPDHDVAHAMWAYPSGWALQGLDIPKVVTFLGSDIHRFSTVPIAGRVIGSVARNADACVAVDSMGSARLDAIGARRIEEIPTGFRIGAFSPSPRPDAHELLYAGRLSREKGVDVLLDAFLIARTIDPTLTLRILGDGPERARLERRTHALRIDDAVTFCGAVPHSEVYAALLRARALVLPSRREGLPAAALEALAVGRPVIGTAVGGLPDLLAGRAGAIVEPENPRALAFGVLKGIFDNWEPAFLRERAERYRIEHASSRYLSVYSGVLGWPRIFTEERACLAV